MKQRVIWYGLAGLLIGLILGIGWGIFRPQMISAPTVKQSNNNSESTPTNTSTNTSLSGTTEFTTLDLPDRDPVFDFSAKIPTMWAVEYISESKAINIYDPRGSEKSSLENSKIFIKYFSASRFETLTTVDILQQSADSINDRSAMRYTIRKKPSVANFNNQPSWRSGEHSVVDIRTTSATPTIFYVFAKAPDVDTETFETFLRSLNFTIASRSSQVVYPLKDFLARITKKKYGQYITPKNSPVSPERFSGYHTGVDAEILTGEETTPVDVYSIADGIVVQRRFVSGYGGVAMIEHQILGQTVTALYGHLQLASMNFQPGDTTTAGQKIGVLGAGGTEETDGERKHLHFGILKGSSTNVQGYVSKSSALSSWFDPVDWLKGLSATTVTI